MKKLALKAVVAISGITNVFAYDGTITINGLVTDQTCEITTPTGKDFTVILPAVSKNALVTSGDTAGRTPFQIKLEKCSAGKVATYFEPGPTVNFTSGHLENQDSSGAQNVGVQLLGSNHQPILVKAAGASGAQDNSQWIDVVEGGSADLNYYAEYFAKDASTAGVVTTSVKYTIIYQ